MARKQVVRLALSVDVETADRLMLESSRLHLGRSGYLRAILTRAWAMEDAGKGILGVLLGVLLLVVALAPAVRAEGERPSDPVSVSFFAGGAVSSGRFENLEFEDGRVLRLSDTLTTGAGGTYGTAYIPPYLSFPYEDWDAHPDDATCADVYTDEEKCVDESTDLYDGNLTFLDTSMNATESFFFSDLWDLRENPTDTLESITAIYTIRASNNSGTSYLNISYMDVAPPAGTLCAWSNHTTIIASWKNYALVISNPACTDEFTGGGYIQFSYGCVVCTRAVALTATDISGTFQRGAYEGMGAELSVPSASEYPIRAEWTCTERDGGPYYIGARTGSGTRWLNVTREADNTSYPSGEMCPVAGPAERYHAAMNASDLSLNPTPHRVLFRIADNISDPTGYLTGNVTLDRLVAILTADFQVSVANLGWLLYLAFMTVGILTAVWGFYLWRSRE